MNERKKIDRLFQERFKDFEAAPDDRIWNAIHNELHEKKKRRVIPLWWKLSGIAAGFILAFFTFQTFSEDWNNEPEIVNAPKESNDNHSIKQNATPQNAIQIADESDATSINKEENNSQINKNDSIQKSVAKNELKVNSAAKQNNRRTKNSAFAYNSKVKNKEDLDEINVSSKDKLAEKTSSISEKINEKNKFLVAELFNKTDKFTNKTKIQKDIDSTAFLLATEHNPLEEILKKKNEKDLVIVQTEMNRWRVTTNVAPIYFNSVSNGSPIEAQFGENSKSYQNNLSVGVGVQYAVNKKLAFRTGVNKVTLGYGTNDVVFFGALKASPLSTLNSSIESSNIEIMSANNVVGLRPFEDNFQNMEKGVLNQRMGYYEIPLEVSYAIINRKFGIQVIGGLSTLFLSDNSVSVQSANTKMSLGKANNLNDIHFSGNAGLGFNYQFWKSFEAHFEPTFKYQFNTFSRDAGNFKPYFVGLYTGVSFKF